MNAEHAEHADDDFMSKLSTAIEELLGAADAQALFGAIGGLHADERSAIIAHVEALTRMTARKRAAILTLTSEESDEGEAEGPGGRGVG